MKNLFRYLLLLTLTVSFTACTTPTVSEEKVLDESLKAMGDTLGGTEYLGRKNGYDYYYVRRNVGGKKYRVKVVNESAPKLIPYDHISTIPAPTE